MFAIFCTLFGTAGYTVAAATIVARILSGNLNFVLNRTWSFRDDRSQEGSPAGQLLRYAILFVGIMLASSGAVTLLRVLPIPLVVTKACVDAALAVVSFLLQKNWVFRRKKEEQVSAQAAERRPQIEQSRIK